MNRHFGLFAWVVFFIVTGACELNAQGIIRGRVNDAQTNDPIPFANVVVQGETVGTTTDFDGNYELNSV
ncbi:MAG: carboxypeptidase-like regulatory domain-containing protein, partial [Flavobacteriales bacterium]|nr:carboxypeptidase-like regulatory domain-containing protein [Flavobacteriales bacterium]